MYSSLAMILFSIGMLVLYIVAFVKYDTFKMFNFYTTINLVLTMLLFSTLIARVVTWI